MLHQFLRRTNEKKTHCTRIEPATPGLQIRCFPCCKTQWSAVSSPNTKNMTDEYHTSKSILFSYTVNPVIFAVLFFAIFSRIVYIANLRISKNLHLLHTDSHIFENSLPWIHKSMKYITRGFLWNKDHANVKWFTVYWHNIVTLFSYLTCDHFNSSWDFFLICYIQL